MIPLQVGKGHPPSADLIYREDDSMSFSTIFKRNGLAMVAFYTALSLTGIQHRKLAHEQKHTRTGPGKVSKKKSVLKPDPEPPRNLSQF